MRSKVKVEKKTFKNMINQELNPGDPVVYVTTGYGHSVNVGTGVYEGVINSHYSRNSKVRISGINKRRFKWDRVNHTGHYEDYIGVTTLKCNRVFKLDTPLSKVSI